MSSTEESSNTTTNNSNNNNNNNNNNITISTSNGNDERTLRQRIIAIQQDSTLSGAEKARRMQALMTAQYAAARAAKPLVSPTTTLAASLLGTAASALHACDDTIDHHHHHLHNNNATVDSHDGTVARMQPVDQPPSPAANMSRPPADAIAALALSDSPCAFDLDGRRHAVPGECLVPSYHERSSKTLGCKHYQRAVRYQAACCGQWYVCRFCHDDANDHHVNRHATEMMMCMHCNTIQPVGQDCKKCSARLGEYFCDVCKLWDSDKNKQIYHCDKCGICRIGQGLEKDYFHCDKCNVCMAINLRNNHRCIERNLESDCPICGEYMFTSTHTVMFMPCGHCMHWRCYQQHIKNSYQCPICWKSLADMSHYFRQIDRMLEQHQMPPEYADFWSIILCNDCEQRSKTKYHFLYHKCQQCHSYNTKLLTTVQEATEAHACPNPSSDDDEHGDALVTPSSVATVDELAANGTGSARLSSSVPTGMVASIPPPRLRSVSSASTASGSSMFMMPDDNENRRRD